MTTKRVERHSRESWERINHDEGLQHTAEKPFHSLLLVFSLNPLSSPPHSQHKNFVLFVLFVVLSPKTLPDY
jgi:hypothetical protein